MQGKVEICGVNTAMLPVLKGPEMRLLLEQARAGDARAREKLISGNLRLVLSVVQKFSGRESMDDLFQVGVIGLIKAVDAFDLSQNVQFSTYGVPANIEWRKADISASEPPAPSAGFSLYNNRGTPNSVPQLKVRVISDYSFEDENPSD